MHLILNKKVHIVFLKSFIAGFSIKIIIIFILNVSLMLTFHFFIKNLSRRISYNFNKELRMTF